MENVFKARGDLSIVVRRATDGSVQWRYEIRNMITYAGLEAMVNLISQLTTVTPADHKVAYLGIGTGTTAPVRTQTDLVTPAMDGPVPYRLALLDANKFLTMAPTFEMKVTATVPSVSPVDGLALTEAGLYTYGGTVVSPVTEYPAGSGRYPKLFARQIHPAINKTTALVIDYDWRISFTA